MSVSAVKVRLWGGPKCGETIPLDTGIYGLPDDLRFDEPGPPPSLEDAMNPDHRESRIAPHILLYVRYQPSALDGVQLYAYEPYISHSV